jgi:hypothetical protein
MPSKQPVDASAIQASIDLIAKSNAPLTLAEIVNHAAPGRKSSSVFKSQLANELGGRTAEPGVYEWPAYSRTRIFCGRTVQAAVEAEFLRALAGQPLTAPKAAPIVSKALRRISTEQVLKAIKPAISRLVSERSVYSFAANRQSVVFFSFLWLEGLLAERKVDHPAADIILEAVRELQPGHGNYVRVDHLRAARPVRHLVDDVVIELADAGKLVLARYDGSHQIPDSERIEYIEDKQGELFIGVALPRSEE